MRAISKAALPTIVDRFKLISLVGVSINSIL